MNKFHKIFFLIVFALTFTHCSKDETAEEPTPLRDFTEQKIADNTKIVEYLKNHKITVDANFDVVFEKTSTALHPSCIWGTNDSTHGSNLLEKQCTSNGVVYTIYYLNLRQGGQGAAATTTRKPCNIDAVLTAFKGRLMEDFVPAVVNSTTGEIITPSSGGASATDIGTVFDFTNFPQSYIELDRVIRGWSEIFPLFNTGNYIANADGTTTYNDFGAGVMFVPSGLAYFNNAAGSIPSYTPIIFNFKLFEIRRNDHDFDGIEDYNENLNGEELALPTDVVTGPKGSYIYYSTSNINGTPTVNQDDTDKDGFPDAFDQDDDGDNYLTKTELKKPALSPPQYDSNGVPINTGYYDFLNVPNCSDNKKKYLSSACH